MARTRISLAALAVRIRVAHTGSALRWRTSLRSVLAVMAACGLTFATLVATPAGAVASTHQYVIDELAKPEYAGRVSGTPGYARAVDFVEREMKAVGMQPAIDGSTFRLKYTAGNAVLNSEEVSLNGRRLKIAADYQPFARTVSGTFSFSSAYYAGDGLEKDYHAGSINAVAIFHWFDATGVMPMGMLDRISIATAHGATAVVIIADGLLKVNNSGAPTSVTFFPSL